jgi:hypothetical protein
MLVTGASGVGKSTVRSLIAPELVPVVECVELLDLTPRPPAITRAWRQQTAELAVRRAVDLDSTGRHLLLAGDPVPAIEVAAAPSASELDAIAVCLLDASADAQAARLQKRGEPAELLRHHQAFAEWMRHQARDPRHMTHVVSDGGWDQMRWDRLGDLAADWQIESIDTSSLSAEDVAASVLDWCRRAISGDAPTLHVNSS